MFWGGGCDCHKLSLRTGSEAELQLLYRTRWDLFAFSTALHPDPLLTCSSYLLTCSSPLPSHAPHPSSHAPHPSQLLPGSYGGGDVHEGRRGRMTQEVSPLPHQQNEVLKGQTQGTNSDLCMYSSKAFATSSVCHYATPKS